MAYDSDKTAINVSIYLSLTSLSSVISSYFGGYLIEALDSNRKVFIISSFLPILTFIAGLITTENSTENLITSPRHSHCSSARINLIKVFQCLKSPQVFKPVIFIFLVVVAPGITDALFYYRSDVLNFNYTILGDLNACMSLAIIVGVWFYSLLLKKVPFRRFMVVITILLAIV